MHNPHEEQPFSVVAADGYRLHGFVWRYAPGDGDKVARPLVIINAATSVRCRYYARFVAFLHGHGFDVLTYDYWGIGESQPRSPSASLRGFHASWLDWGQRLDALGGEVGVGAGEIKLEFEARGLSVGGHGRSPGRCSDCSQGAAGCRQLLSGMIKMPG